MKAGDIWNVSLETLTQGSLTVCVESTESNHHKRSICFRDTALKARIVFPSA